MNNYLVTWQINVDADDPRDAANWALKIMQNPDSIATVFDVQDKDGNTTRVDLLEDA